VFELVFLFRVFSSFVKVLSSNFHFQITSSSIWTRRFLLPSLFRSTLPSPEQRETVIIRSQARSFEPEMAEGRGGNGGATTSSTKSTDACCDPNDSAAAHLSARASRLEAEARADPTLQDCCRRDLEQEAAASRQQAALSRVDRASRAELARKLGGAVVPPPRPPPPKAENGEEDLDSDFGDDEDNEASLARLRDLRLSQMKREQEERKQQKVEGAEGEPLLLGRLSEINVSKVFALAASLPSLSQGPPREKKKRELPFVVHLADPGSAAGASLDELLETLAGDFRGSRFARAAPGKKSTEVRASVLVAVSASPMPAAQEGAGGILAVFRGGALVAAVPVAAFCAGESGGGGGELVEESVVSWLRKSRALSKEKNEKVKEKKKEENGAAPPSSSDDEDESNSDGEGDDDADPCEVCGRTYFHTHVRPVRSGGRGGCGGGGGGGESGDDDGDESGSD